jgi:hypothetical protein
MKPHDAVMKSRRNDGQGNSRSYLLRNNPKLLDDNPSDVVSAYDVWRRTPGTMTLSLASAERGSGGRSRGGRRRTTTGVVIIS